MNSMPSAAQGPKPLLPPTTCAPELRTLTAHDIASGSDLQTLLTASFSFSSSSYNPTAPDLEAARIPLLHNQGKSVTLASVWTPVEQKPSLRQHKGLRKAQGSPPGSGHSGRRPRAGCPLHLVPRSLQLPHKEGEGSTRQPPKALGEAGFPSSSSRF